MPSDQSRASHEYSKVISAAATPNGNTTHDGEALPPMLSTTDYTILETEYALHNDSSKPVINLTLDAEPAVFPNYKITNWTLANVGLCALFGAAYLSHAQFRRVNPRRLPTLTALKLGELYASGAALSVTVSESVRHVMHAGKDRDLFTVYVAAATFRDCALESIGQKRAAGKSDTLKLFKAIGGIPSNTSLLDRLQWRYHLALGGIVPFNLVVRTILKGVQDHSAKGGHLPAGVNLGDIFILGSHIANTITLADASSPENVYPSLLAESHRSLTHMLSAQILSYRCQWGIIAITPFAMLARWKRLVLLALPLNLVQRALIHGLLMTSIATVHQLARYPATLHNRHAAAELLCITIPDLREEVVKLMRDGVSVPELW